MPKHFVGFYVHAASEIIIIDNSLQILEIHTGANFSWGLEMDDFGDFPIFRNVSTMMK